jgi:putative ABC transport system permease protein
MGLLLTEVALLVAPAVALGASLAVAGVALITPYLPIGVPWIRGTGVNATVLALTALVGCLTVLATGLVPALAQSRPDLSRAGRRGTASDTPTPSATRLVNGLVVGQVALAVVLLVCTALLVRSAAQVARVDPGFVPDRLLSATIALPENKFDWDHNAVFSRDVVTAVTALPGVVEAAVVQGVPMQAAGFNDRYEVEGAPAMPDQDRPLAGLRVISPGYFRTMQIPLVAGRSFTERDGVCRRGLRQHAGGVRRQHGHCENRPRRRM